MVGPVGSAFGQQKTPARHVKTEGITNYVDQI